MYYRQKSKTLQRMQLDLTLSIKAREAFSNYINEVLSHLHGEQRFLNFACKKLILKIADKCQKSARKAVTEPEITKLILDDLGEPKDQAQKIIKETHKGRGGMINLIGFIGVVLYLLQEIIERLLYFAPLIIILVLIFSYFETEANKLRAILIDKQGLRKKGARKKLLVIWLDIYKVVMPSKRRLIIVDRKEKAIKFFMLFFPVYLISCILKNSPSGVYIAPSLLSTYDKEMTKLDSSIGFSDIYRQIILPEKINATISA